VGKLGKAGSLMAGYCRSLLSPSTTSTFLVAARTALTGHLVGAAVRPGGIETPWPARYGQGTILAFILRQHPGVGWGIGEPAG
jgi:hypothetical protein